MRAVDDDTGSAKRLNKNGCTSSRVSGPPRFNNKTPTFSSSSLMTGAVDEMFEGLEATKALKGNECFPSSRFERNAFSDGFDEANASKGNLE